MVAYHAWDSLRNTAGLEGNVRASVKPGPTDKNTSMRAHAVMGRLARLKKAPGSLQTESSE